MNLAPIVLFAYNRPHYLELTLQALQANPEAGQSKLIVYCDGPKPDSTKEELILIEQVAEVLLSRKWCGEMELVKSTTNNGLSKAIIAGVSESVNKYGKVIVLEDDLVVSKYFLRYMNESLDLYENEKDVLSIVGYNYPVKKNYPASQQTFFLKAADCLGWATWKDKWDLFETDSSLLITKMKSSDIREFNFDNNYPFYTLLKRTADGKASSWAIRWYATAFLLNKLSLYPAMSLVKHIGNEGSNIKVDNTDFLGDELSEIPVTVFPKHISEDKIFRSLITNHFQKFNRRRLSVHSIKYAFKRIVVYRLKELKKKFQ